MARHAGAIPITRSDVRRLAQIWVQRRKIAKMTRTRADQHAAELARREYAYAKMMAPYKRGVTGLSGACACPKGWRAKGSRCVKRGRKSVPRCR